MVSAVIDRVAAGIGPAAMETDNNLAVACGRKSESIVPESANIRLDFDADVAAGARLQVGVLYTAFAEQLAVAGTDGAERHNHAYSYGPTHKAFWQA